MSFHLGISLGPSFVDFCIISQDRPKAPVAYRRYYLSSSPLQNILKKFLQENSNFTPISKVLVASRFLEKILDTRLGGSVAQIVTQGFENWPLLRQSLQNPTFFELTPTRTEPLASQDLIFGVKERVSSSGESLQEPDPEELDQIVKKLKSQSIERVCINFLFSEKNPTHQNKVAQYFTENGFEVFAAIPMTGINDEILSWRRNVLNASLLGTFREVQENIQLGGEGVFENKDISYLDGDGQFFNEDKNRISSSLFGPMKAISTFYPNSSQILFLGMEKWAFIKPQVQRKIWQSPWGPLAGQVPLVMNLRLQPTSELIVNDFGQIEWSTVEMSFEPGPMALGRAHRPTVFDTLSFDGSYDAFSTIVTASGKSKFQSTLQTMIKHSDSSQKDDFETTLKSLNEYIVDQMGLKVLMERENLKEPIVCTGVFSPLLYPSLKKRWPEINWELCPYSKEIEGLAIANKGFA